jgi:hypothetical protein
MTAHRHRRVYLSGGMEYADNEGRDWRAQMQQWLESELDCSVFNPNRESQKFFETRYPGLDFRALKRDDKIRYREIVGQLVDFDSREIAERSDFVICYWDQSAMRGGGTKGELTMARFFGKPVYMVTAVEFGEIPGWVLGCTQNIFPDFESLRRFLSSPQQ